MGFFAPLALVGLVAAAIPILAHLSKQRDLPRLTLPTVQLLARARAASEDKVKVTDPLLLLVRIALIAAVVFAASRPFFTTRAAFASTAPTALVIVVDDSLSMARESGLDRARAIAEENIAALPAGSSVSVVLAGDPARTALPLTTDLDRARALFETLPSTCRGTDLAGAARKSAQELTSSERGGRLLVLSDFASDGVVQWPRVDAVFTDLSDAEAVNRAIEEVSVQDDPTSGGASYWVQLSGSPGEVEIGLMVGGELVDHKTVEVSEAGGATTVLRGDRGDAEVRLLTPDAIALDDAFRVLSSQAGPRVLVVNGDPHAARVDDEAAYLTRALAVAPVSRGLSPVVVDADSLTSDRLRDVDVVFFANVAPLPGPINRAFAAYVEGGGGLIVGVGDRSRRSDLELPARIGPVTRGAFNIASGPVADDRDLDSDRDPAGDAVAPPRLASLSLDRAQIQARVELDPTDDADVTLRFRDGSPAVVTARRGAGRITMLATTLDDDWTDLPLRPSFVPLIDMLVRSSTRARGVSERTFQCGEPLEGTSVTTPTGDEIEADGRFRATDQPGRYLLDGREVHVVGSPEERSTRAANVPAAQDEGGLAEGGVAKHEVASIFFLLFGVLGVLELALRSRSSRRKTSAAEL